VLNQAADRYLEYEEWFARRVGEGMADAETGRILPHDEVMAGLREKISRNRNG
jgi:predicted transcriptional regulator